MAIKAPFEVIKLKIKKAREIIDPPRKIIDLNPIREANLTPKDNDEFINTPMMGNMI